MFYVLTPPDCEAARIHLFPSRDAAIAQAGGEKSVYAVAVEFDRTGRCLVVPIWVILESVEAAWTTPAELHGDGSLTAKGTIPRALFVGRVHAPKRARGEATVWLRWRTRR
jgi:hypothetical protein